MKILIFKLNNSKGFFNEAIVVKIFYLSFNKFYNISLKIERALREKFWLFLYEYVWMCSLCFFYFSMLALP